MDGDEVLQLYVGFPGSSVSRPIKALKGFKRVRIPAGQTGTVHIPLKSEDLKYWSEADHSWILEKGTVQIMVGAASDDIRLKGNLAVQ